MTDLISNEIIQVINFLLPGFIVTWIFYRLTAWSRPSEFERVVQALIYTVFVQFLIIVIQWVFIKVGQFVVALGTWTQDSKIIWSVLIALGLGILSSWLANTDKLHLQLRNLKLTKETSFPSEWYGNFYQNNFYVVLHLTGERRLYGYPEEWPSDPEHGHFVVAEAEWLIEECNQSKPVPLKGVDKILIPAKEVSFVEFMERNSTNSKENSCESKGTNTVTESSKTY